MPMPSHLPYCSRIPNPSQVRDGDGALCIADETAVQIGEDRLTARFWGKMQGTAVHLLLCLAQRVLRIFPCDTPYSTRLRSSDAA